VLQSIYRAETTALLLVDPYNDFLSEGGKVWPWVKAIAMGARSAGNPHAACDVEGAGNVAWPNRSANKRRAGAHDQKLAQVSVAHPGDAPEPFLAPGRTLAWREPEEGRELEDGGGGRSA
jgi:hypothetical protein